MLSITDIRERVNGAIHRAKRAEKTDPIPALHEAFIATFPCAPDVDLSFTSEPQARTNPKRKVKTETFVTTHATTTEAEA